MKILFLSPEAGLGGAERSLLTFIKWLHHKKQNEMQCHVLLFTDGPLFVELENLGVNVKVLHLPNYWKKIGSARQELTVTSLLRTAVNIPGFLFFLVKLHRQIYAINPNVIHSNGIKSHLISVFILSRSALVWHIHDFLSFRRPLRSWLRLFSKKTTLAIANSFATAFDATHVLSCPITVCHNGVTNPESEISIENIPGAKIRVGLVATFAKWKGHELFFEAAQKYVEQNPDCNVEFVVQGGPIYQTKASQWQLEELKNTAIKTYGLGGNIIFRPFENDLDKIYADLDVVINASTEPEPFGLTLIEAMQRGKIVLAPSWGAAREIIDDQSGFLFEPNSANDFAKQLSKIMSSQNLWPQIRKNACAKITNNFQIEKTGPVFLTALAASKTIKNKEAHGQNISGIAVGYKEDHWHSMTLVAQHFFRHISKLHVGTTFLFHPSLGKKPKWYHRRILFGRSIPFCHFLFVSDHSYGDSILNLRFTPRSASIFLHDAYFLTSSRFYNLLCRQRILSGIQSYDFKFTISRATTEQYKQLGCNIDWVSYLGCDHLPKFLAGERKPFQLLHVGGTDPRKNLEALFQILNLLPKSFYLIHAGAPFSKKQKELIQRLGLDDQIKTILNPTEKELAELYSQSRITLVPSTYEGLSIVALEARVQGCQVLLNSTVPAFEILSTDPGTLALDFSDRENDIVAAQLIEKTIVQSVPWTDSEKFTWQKVSQNIFERIKTQPVE